jgi:hypothetical protein
MWHVAALDCAEDAAVQPIRDGPTHQVCAHKSFANKDQNITRFCDLDGFGVTGWQTKQNMRNGEQWANDGETRMEKTAERGASRFVPNTRY